MRVAWTGWAAARRGAAVPWRSGNATVAVQRPVQDSDGAGDDKRAGAGEDR